MSDTDAELMRRASADDSAAFAELVRRYRPALVRVAGCRLSVPEAAEDVVQETFLAAYKSRHTFDDRFGFRTWLWTILLNQCRRYATRQAARGRVSSLDARNSDEQSSPLELADAASANGALEKLLAAERRQVLETLLAELSAVQADALRLRFFGGLKFQEIADAMGCTLCTAKNRVRWGLLKLSELVQRESAGQPSTERPQFDATSDTQRTPTSPVRPKTSYRE